MKLSVRSKTIHYQSYLHPTINKPNIYIFKGQHMANRETYCGLMSSNRKGRKESLLSLFQVQTWRWVGRGLQGVCWSDDGVEGIVETLHSYLHHLLERLILSTAFLLILHHPGQWVDVGRGSIHCHTQALVFF